MTFDRKEYDRQYYQTHKKQKKEYKHQYYQTRKEQLNEYMRQYYQAHKEQRKEYNRQWFQTHKEQVKGYNRRYRKKLGKKLEPKEFCKDWKLCFPDTFQKLLIIQEGRCAVCSVSLEHHQIHVDHDHKTGFVRGLLCWHCNRFRVSQNRSDNIKQVYEYLLNPPAIQLE